MNINLRGANYSFFGRMAAGNGGLKSTQQKIQRQEERDNKIAFFEQQKDNLKNWKCETVEEIAKKLDMFHSYEDQIAAAKAAYNNEQMMHMMDESREQGEKIAKAVDKMAPKTAEERLEDLVEEALGIDEGTGILDEVLDEVAEIQEELQDAVQEELQDTMQEDVQDVMEQELQDAMQEEVQAQSGDEAVQMEDGIEREINAQQLQKKLYAPIDLRI